MDSTTNTVYYDLNSAVRQLTDSVDAKAKTDLCLEVKYTASFTVVTAVLANEKIIAICSKYDIGEYKGKDRVYYDCSIENVLKCHTNSESTDISAKDIIRYFSFNHHNLIVSIYEFADKRLKLTDRYTKIDSFGSPKTQLGEIIILSE